MSTSCDLRLKVHFRRENERQEVIRRWGVSSDITWAALNDDVKERFAATGDIEIKYVDLDGDRVVMRSQLEWEECVQVLNSSDVLRLHVTQPTSIATTLREAVCDDCKWNRFPFGNRLQKMNTRALGFMENGEYLNAMQVLQSAFNVSADPIVMYNIACCHALLGDRAKAIRALEQAVALGYDNGRHMAGDPDLESLRNEEEFLMLVTSLESTTSCDTQEATNRRGRCPSVEENCYPHVPITSMNGYGKGKGKGKGKGWHRSSGGHARGFCHPWPGMFRMHRLGNYHGPSICADLRAQCAMEHGNYQRALRLLNGYGMPKSAENMFLRACCHAMSGDKKQALEALQDSIMNGYPEQNPDWHQDWRLESIFSEEKFQQLFAAQADHDGQAPPGPEAASQTDTDADPPAPDRAPMDHLVDELCALAMAVPQLAQWMSSAGPEIAAGFAAAGPQVQQRLAALGPEIAGEFAAAGPHLKEMASAGPQLAAAVATAASQALGMFSSFQQSPSTVPTDTNCPKGQPTNSEPSSEPPVEQEGAPANVSGEQVPEALADELMQEQTQPPHMESTEQQMEKSLVTLSELGFPDAAHNRQVLEDCEGSMVIAISRLLED